MRETEVEIRELVAAGRAGSKLGEPFDSYAAGNLIGTPEQVAERIRAYADLGCTYVVPWCADHPDDTTLRLFAEQVMPELR